MATRAMSIGVSGMAAGQQALSIIANNIANSETTGFKSQEAVFEELFYQQWKSPVAANEERSGQNPIDIGNGVKLGSVTTNHSQGNIVYTGNKTDLAIQGEGYFIVGNVEGMERLYTRAGNFQMSSDNKLQDTSGNYVLGWNYELGQTAANSGAALEPIEIPLGKISTPMQSTELALKGNLNINEEIGSIQGAQMPSWDRLGARHDVNIDFVKTGGNSYTYVANPLKVATESTSIQNMVLNVDKDTAPQMQKGDYKITTAPGGTAGTVDITVTAPDGSTVLTQNVIDTDQTVTLKNGTEKWFTVDYKTGGTGTATYQVAEVGTVSFDALGKISGITGSGPGGSPLITYTPVETGQPVNINIDFSNITGFASKGDITVKSTDGIGASVLTNYTITDDGLIAGYFNDGTVRAIAQVATATFSNSSGLSRVGTGMFQATLNSGLPNTGLPGTGDRGTVKSQAKESSNVDLAKEFVDMLTQQKTYQANTKIIRTSDDILSAVLQLVR